MQIKNLLTTLRPSPQQEQFQTLLENQHARLQRIISPPHYRSGPLLQSENEWVLVLQGTGTLELPEQTLTLVRGDCLVIPAGTPHRIMTTSEKPLCIWLALHLEADGTRMGR